MGIFDNLHGLSVHLHTGILVLALITSLFSVIIRFIIYLYPRWNLIKDLFSDWTITKKIYDNKEPIFKAFDYSTIIFITLGVVGLLVGMWTGSNAVNWDFSGAEAQYKLVLSIWALLFYLVALVLGTGLHKQLWDNAGLLIIYIVAIFFGFFFIFISAAVGGLITYGDSIAKPILIWLQNWRFFELLGLPVYTF